MMTRALFAGSFALTGLSLWLWLAPAPPPASPALEAIRANPTPVVVNFPKTDPAGVVSRALFRPVPPPKPALPPRSAPVRQHPAMPPQERKMRLLGIIDEAGVRIAFILIDGERDAKRITQGQAIGEWRVEAIGPRNAELTRSGNRKILFLDPPKSP